MRPPFSKELIPMPNPVLTPQRWQEQSDDKAGWAAPAAGAAGMAGGLGARTMQPATGMPDADQPRMTIGGTMLATAVLFVLLLVTGAIGWAQVTQTETTTIVQGVPQTSIQTDFPGWIWIPMLVALGLAFVTVFKPKLARITAPLYALGYGFALGAISHMYNLQWDGIVLQAVGATLAVFAVMLFLYATRIIKVTKRYVLVVVAATGGIFVLYLVTAIASLFGADIAFWNDPTPLGIGISVVIVIVAALNLAIDFAFIEQASNAGEPKYMEWLGAFGLTVTLIWLYLEILRLLSLLRQ
jgi:uncharacterized YccA/Bax inhibitor family protein